MPVVLGGDPAAAQDTSRASGRRPSSAAFPGLVTTHTAAPSFCPLALPAVTGASGSSLPMIGRSFARVSTVESGGIGSSRAEAGRERGVWGKRGDLGGGPII